MNAFLLEMEIFRIKGPVKSYIAEKHRIHEDLTFHLHFGFP